jgi:hypothetical protein
MLIVLSSIFAIDCALAGALEKLAIEASASATERQCTTTSHSPLSPAADFREMKPVVQDVLKLDRLANGRNSSAVTPALGLNVTISMTAPRAAGVLMMENIYRKPAATAAIL